MRHTKSLVFNALLVALLTSLTLQVHAQQAGAKPAQRKLTVVGTHLFAPLVADIARRFESSHPGFTIAMNPDGVAKGLVDLRANVVDIVMMPRPLQERERDLFAYPIARDGVAIVVNRDNPLKDMTSNQMTSILTARYTNWKELGGRDARIKLGWREGEGTTAFVLDLLKLKREQLGPRILLVHNDEAIRFAAADPDALVIASVSDAERSVQAGTRIKLLAFNGFTASTRTIQNHSYALSRPLMLVVRRLPEGRTKEFIDYAASKRVIDLQLKYGVVPYQE